MPTNRNTMNEPYSSTAENKGVKLLVPWLAITLSFFPLMALLTYDWRSIPQLMNPPAPHSNWIGALGDGFAYYGYTIFGLAVWLIPAISLLSGINAVRKHKLKFAGRGVWYMLMIVSVSCLLQVIGRHGGAVASISEKINLSDSGGVIGYLIMTKMLSPLISDFASSIVMAVILVASIFATVGTSNITAAAAAIWEWAMAGGIKNRETAASGANDIPGFPAHDESDPYEAIRRAKEEARRQREEEKLAAKREKEARKLEKIAAKKAAREAAVNPPVQRAPSPPPTSAPAGDSKEDKGPYLLPPLSLLNPLKKSSADHGNVGETKKQLIDTLRIFGVDATLDYTVEGPVVTKYAISLAPGTRYNAVTSISDNLMGALRAKSLRIEAPIPGENRVGIEVPNRSSAGISFREIIESDTWKNFKGDLPLLFGKDAAGVNLVADLAKMPHMLVAGATGQGKSVCLNAIINGLLMSKTPGELKFILIDPKSVEFTPYASIPHLLAPVITDNNKAAGALRWAVVEMEKRLKMFSACKVRNINDFNHRPRFTQTNIFGDDTPVGSSAPDKIPHIIIIIDEVADLMAVAAKEVVPYIGRIAAKARAAGIHIILATQRPDAKVITGTIKANIPGRVAFKTATAIDSRTILDESGAESLIGKGDMLFRTAEGILLRAQGAWIGDDEISRITEFIAEHSTIQYDESISKKLGKIKETNLDDDDESADGASDDDGGKEQNGGKASGEEDDFKLAIECILETNRASISFFQRKFRWGYNHSARIVDMLEDAGVISPQAGAGPRQIIMSPEELQDLYNNTGKAGNAKSDSDAAAENDAGEPSLFNMEEPQ